MQSLGKQVIQPINEIWRHIQIYKSVGWLFFRSKLNSHISLRICRR